MCAHVHTHMLKCHIFGVMERQRAGFLHSKGLIYIDSVKSNLCWILFLLQPICCPTNDKFRGQNRGKVQWAHTPSRNILQTIQYSLQTTHLPAPRVEGAQHDGPRTYKPGVAFQLEPQQAVQPWALYLIKSQSLFAHYQNGGIQKASIPNYWVNKLMFVKSSWMHSSLSSPNNSLTSCHCFPHTK